MIDWEREKKREIEIEKKRERERERPSQFNKVIWTTGRPSKNNVAWSSIRWLSQSNVTGPVSAGEGFLPFSWRSLFFIVCLLPLEEISQLRKEDHPVRPAVGTHHPLWPITLVRNSKKYIFYLHLARGTRTNTVTKALTKLKQWSMFQLFCFTLTNVWSYINS